MLLTFDSASDLARALRRAADAHRRHEKQTGRPDADWPNWYGLYLELEQAGLEHLLIPGRLEGATVPVAIVTSRTEAELIVGMLRNYDADEQASLNRNELADAPTRARARASTGAAGPTGARSWW
jgi:hypothetical protein